MMAERRLRRWGWQTRCVLAGLFSFLFMGTSLHAADSAKELASMQARPAPEWLTRGVIYQIWLRSFTPEGTLAAATKRLPAVAELGAGILYLSPICLQDADMRREFWSERQKASGTDNPRNPYRIADYNRVDPEYGSEADLREFVTTAHRLKQHVLLDMVYFHCGPTSVLLEHPEWLKHDADGKISTGEWHFPVLNFANRQLREYLWANMLHWLKDFDVDGFRCDVADAVPLDFWEEARSRLEAVRPDVVIFAEGQRPADQVRAFDIDYGFSWFDTLKAVGSQGQPASALRAVHEKQAAARPCGARFTRYTENHDIVNDMQRADVMYGKRCAAAMSALNFTMDGVPFLYNGQEIGDTTVQSIYARWPIRWEAACLPSSQTTLKFYKGLCALRKAEAALTAGETVWLDNDQPGSVVSFVRRLGDDVVVSVVNLSNRKVEVKVALPAGVRVAAKPLISDRARATAGDGSLALAFDGCGHFVAKKP